jgi:GH15 family glucan-1,4-alpha-glucosidase
VTPHPLVASSVELIARSQAGSGAYVAAPGYETYAYSWLRDGAFIAASMDAHGRSDSAGAFHRWVARSVDRHAAKVQRLEREVAVARRGTGDPLQPLDARYVLHTRFTVDGAEAEGQWGDFQLDGYGFWLTSLASHLALTRADPAPFAEAIDLVCRYLALTWQLPCFDCWEEYPTQHHTTTWAAVAQGLRRTAGLGKSQVAAGIDVEITRRLVSAAGSAAVLRKFVGAADLLGSGSGALEPDEPTEGVAGHERVGRALPADTVDGSALLVLGDYGPFAPSDDIVGNTLRAIEETLVVDGGVHRYLDDEFYGGGVWVVLGGALATVLAHRDEARSRLVLGWIESQADAAGALPEQVSTHLRMPRSLAVWTDRWGPPARPLLWSHAMYLLGVASVHH